MLQSEQYTKCICTCILSKSRSTISDTGLTHKFLSLDDTSARVREDFGELLKKCSVKVTELCKQEKRAWQKIDDLEVECQKMYQEVRSKREELVSFMILTAHQ